MGHKEQSRQESPGALDGQPSVQRLGPKGNEGGYRVERLCKVAGLGGVQTLRGCGRNPDQG